MDQYTEAGSMDVGKDGLSVYSDLVLKNALPIQRLKAFLHLPKQLSGLFKTFIITTDDSEVKH